MTRLELDEADRQMVLLALARLSIARPGWAIALKKIALQIDDEREGSAVMFEQFRALATPGQERAAVAHALEMFDAGTVTLREMARAESHLPPIPSRFRGPKE